ncbi:hypothetical protein DFH09DRAFT_1394899 [Mycena vulgaris]|nr:hypothetical protein DFH09DRAFT_1394899 [Mycena vulgaris]
MPQLDVGSLAPGETAIVQDNDGPQEVVTQNDAPQQVQSIALAATSILRFTSGGSSASARIAQSTTIDPSSATALRSSAAFESTSLSASVASPLTASSTAAAISSVVASSRTYSSVITSSSVASSSSALIPSASVSSSASSSSTPTRLALATSASSSQAPSSASSSSTTSAAAASSTSAAAARPYTMTHGAPFYAAIALGGLIAVALLAALLACLIRVRRRRHAATADIGWDPVVLEDAKDSEPDFSLAGDRDVGEPKRSDSFVSRRASYPAPGGPFDGGYSQHPNPFAESAYYTPYQSPPLADSAAYPLPPAPLSNNGPYPTSRPLPAHLADRDPHRISQRGSAASSRSGSVRSHLPSAATLVVANASSRASTALGMHAAPQHDYDFDFGGAPVHRQSVPELEFGTPREREARPRFMSLGSGRGLDVPWRRESFAVRGGGQPGWAPLPAPGGEQEGEQEQGDGWTQTIRASVLGAFHAVTGAASAAPQEDNDGLTRAPSMGRERRESGWRRFAAQEMDGSNTSSRASGRGIIPERGMGTGMGHLELAPPPAALQLSGISLRSDADTVRTDNSRVPLIPRPAPASRASSVYSTVSAAPPVPAYGYGSRARG